MESLNNMDISQMSDVELYKAKSEILMEVLRINSNLNAVNAEITKRESKPAEVPKPEQQPEVKE